MPSPFPGMDPYLEDPRDWSGVHLSFLVFAMAELNRHLPTGFVAKVDEYVWVRDTETEEEELLGRPDVLIPQVPRAAGTTGTLTRPLSRPTSRTRLPEARRRKTRVVHIVTSRGERIVTVLELLSPSNKSSREERDAYNQKRREYLASVNLVEVDLLRHGHRMAMGRPAPAPSDYCVFSCRRSEYPNSDVYAFNVRDPMPVVPVPLDAASGDTPFDLQAVFDRVYAEGNYAHLTNYALPPTPELRKADVAWAEDLVKKHTRKKK